jgi:hypothetical protein
MVGAGAYCVSKAGVDMLIQQFAIELALQVQQRGSKVVPVLQSQELTCSLPDTQLVCKLQVTSP